MRPLLTSLLLLLACSPQSADRATLSDDAAFRPAPDGAAVDAPGIAGADARIGLDARLDRAPPPDTRAPDRSPPPDAAVVTMPPDARPPADAAPDTALSQTALLVVGVPGDLSMGDTRLRTALATKGFTVRIVDDNAAVNVTGIRLVLLSGSCASETLGTKYRDVPVPLVSTEAAVYDTMGMTAGAAALGQTMGGTVTILMPAHPMAAGLQGNVGVVGEQSNLGWGRPAAGAERVASIQGMADNIAIFGYPKGAMMVTGPATDRRVGFFATDDAAPNLGGNGLRLLGAAIDWALLP
jgi:hypothetical protein